MKVIFAVVPIALLFNVILGYPSGAPNQACNSISPDPKRHGAPPQRSQSPFILKIQGNPTEYVPGQQYTLILSRKQKRRFRGFLVVSQNSNKDRVGSFTAGKGQRQTCYDHSGITHSNRLKKKSVTLTWTAPPEGTGAVVFKYAGVLSRKMYWADQQGPILQERSVSSTTAVEPSSKVPLTSSALPSSKVPSSTSTSTASSVAVTSSEVGTSTSSPTPSATTSTATGEATSAPPSSTSVEASSRETSSVAVVTPSVAPIATPSVAPIATPSVAPIATPSVAPIATPSVAPSTTPTSSTSTSAPIVAVPGTDGNGSPGSSSFAGMVMTMVFLIMGLLAMMI